jgi:hypothetical protein
MNDGLNIFRKVDQEKYSESIPSYPALYLTKHVFVKGIVVGSVVGFVATPIVYLVSGRKYPILSVWRTSMTAAPGAFSLISLGLLAGKALNESEDLSVARVDDRFFFEVMFPFGLLLLFYYRAFRLSKNKLNAKIDLYSLYGAAFCGIVLPTVRPELRSIPAAATGAACGIVYLTLEKLRWIGN